MSRKKKSGKGFGCAGILGIFMVLAVIIAIFSPGSPNEDTSAAADASRSVTSQVETAEPEPAAETPAQAEPETEEADPAEAQPAQEEAPPVAVPVVAPVPEPEPEAAAEEPVEEEPAAEEPVSVNYVANKNTGKFHYPSCSSVGDMKESNKLYWTGTRDELVSMGYVPCGRCHP